MKSGRHWLIALIGGTLLAGAAQASLFGPPGFDGWSADEMSVLASMRLSELAPAPADPSNGMNRPVPLSHSDNASSSTNASAATVPYPARAATSRIGSFRTDVR